MVTLAVVVAVVVLLSLLLLLLLLQWATAQSTAGTAVLLLLLAVTLLLLLLMVLLARHRYHRGCSVTTLERAPHQCQQQQEEALAGTHAGSPLLALTLARPAALWTLSLQCSLSQTA